MLEEALEHSAVISHRKVCLPKLGREKHRCPTAVLELCEDKEANPQRVCCIFLFVALLGSLQSEYHNISVKLKGLLITAPQTMAKSNLGAALGKWWRNYQELVLLWTRQSCTTSSPQGAARQNNPHQAVSQTT